MGFLRMTRCAAQQGLALIAVLWIVAALSIVVTSMGYSVRHEVRALSGAKQALTGRAIGEAAIHLVLQDLAPRQSRVPGLEVVNTTFRETQVTVQVLPLSGLIDINNAPPALLAALLSVAGELAADRAAALAAVVVDTRSAKDARGRQVGFEAPEDLLRVPGIDYHLYAKISALVTADVQGNGRVAPLAASQGVLLVLALGNAAKAAGIAADRESRRVGIDLTSLNRELTDSSANSPRYELQARVPLAGGSWLLVSRTVDFGASRNGLPWRTINTSYRFESPGERN